MADFIDRNLSTEEIIKMAAEMFITFSTQEIDGCTVLTHPYGYSAFTSLTIDEMREVDLVFQLLIAAEKVGWKQFETASKFLTRCGWVASDCGTAVERLVYYLCEALQKRIENETGIPGPVKLEKLVSCYYFLFKHMKNKYQNIFL
ncbi:putative transcription factor GRAS family [Helianthus annuus]|nr:putative transcription factor GRAS family [Helianthus annuus]